MKERTRVLFIETRCCTSGSSKTAVRRLELDALQAERGAELTACKKAIKTETKLVH